MRIVEKLNPKRVEILKAPGYHGDGGGLYLQVSANGTKSWVFRYQLNKRAREMGLGSVSVVGLAEARAKAVEQRRLLHEGIDPITAREAARAANAAAAAAPGLTFKQAAEDYIRGMEASWKNEKHGQQWRNTIATFATPIIGNMLVRDIQTEHVVRVLEQDRKDARDRPIKHTAIWRSIPETASRLRGRIQRVITYADKREGRERLNPARLDDHLDVLLMGPSRQARTSHHPALAYTEAPAFMEALRKMHGTAALTAELIILTAVRTGEALGATWREVDLDAGIWTIPAARMKGRRGKAMEHRVPLSAAAVAVLEKAQELSDGKGYVFPGGKPGKPQSNMACLALLERMGRGDLTIHGFRSTFRDWAAECTNFPREVAEMALAHTIKDKTEAAYRRGDLFAKRAKLMEAWGEYCSKPAGAAGNNVTPIAKGGSRQR